MRVRQPCGPLPSPSPQRGPVDLPEATAWRVSIIACVKSAKCLSDGGKKTENKPASRLVLIKNKAREQTPYAMKTIVNQNCPY